MIKKKLLALFALLLSSITVSAYDFEMFGVCYNITSELTVEVTSNPEGYQGDILIPSIVSHNGQAYNVERIGEGAFEGCFGVKNITLPINLKKIGDKAFKNCSGLSNIKIPKNVTEIGNEAFFSCVSLTSVEIPDSVITIGYKAFSDCSSIKSAVIGNSVKTINYSAFTRCNKLESVVLGISVEELNKSFLGCEKLKMLTLNCPKLVEKNWDSNSSLEKELSYSIQKIIFGESITKLGDNLFLNNSSLTLILPIEPLGRKFPHDSFVIS